MLAYIVRRILWTFLLLLAITFVTFVIFFAAPNDPARTVCGGSQASAQCIRAATIRLGLDKPIPVQYGIFVKRLVLDRSLGVSMASGQRVNDTILQAAPVTASLVFGAAVLWLVVGLIVGILSALRPRSLFDRTAMAFVLIGISAHPIWIGLVFEYFFGVKWHVTPIANYANFWGAPKGSGMPGGPWQWFYHLILPWCTFALLFAALYARMIRASVIETLDEDYVRTARAKGDSERRVLFRHVLRNALLPVVTMLGMDVGVALGGAIFTESVYQLHGLGWTLVTAIGLSDFAVVQGVVVFATLAILSLNLVVDVLYAAIDPRIRLAARKSYA
jgi:peptide/nickel transport system permease protein